MVAWDTSDGTNGTAGTNGTRNGAAGTLFGTLGTGKGRALARSARGEKRGSARREMGGSAGLGEGVMGPRWR